MTPSSTLNQVPLLQWHRIAAQGAGHPRLQELGFLPLENVRVLQRSWLPGGALVVLDAATFKEVKRIPMDKPVGKYNLHNKITKSEGTSH